MASELGDVIRPCEGDNGNTAAQTLDLVNVLAQLCEMLLAIQSTEVAEQDQDRRTSEKASSRERATVGGLELEVKLDPELQFLTSPPLGRTLDPA